MSTIKKSPDRRNVNTRTTVQGSHHQKARREEMVRPDSSERESYRGELVIEGVGKGERETFLALLESVINGLVRRKPNSETSVQVGSGGKVTVQSNDANLAVSLGRRLHRSRKGGRLTVTYTDADAPVRVNWRVR